MIAEEIAFSSVIVPCGNRAETPTSGGDRPPGIHGNVILPVRVRCILAKMFIRKQTATVCVQLEER